MKKNILCLFLIVISSLSFSQNPYDLWLQYDNIEEQHILETYKNQVSNIYLSLNSATGTVIKEEIQKAFKGLLDIECDLRAARPHSCILHCLYKYFAAGDQKSLL